MVAGGYRKLWLIVGIAFDIGLLAVFKYLSFISKNIAVLLNNQSIVLDIALPIGISFFTFQLMSYVFDVYYGSVKVQKNPAYLALYVSLFPQLIAGPIVRYSDVENEIINRQANPEDFFNGLKRFVYGLGKKVIIANTVATIADTAFASIGALTVTSAWMGAIAYTFQIYYDFSGYSDMAIGLGKMFGFHFLENFDYPYCSKSITEFWRKWHISLSSWFRDYVYIPLGGNRRGKGIWIRNMFIVWLLTGIWHGANWTFVLWGLFYFAVIIFERLTNIAEKIGPFSRIYTLLIIILAWVMFRSDSVILGIEYIASMFGFSRNAIANNFISDSILEDAVIFAIAALGSTPIIPKLKFFFEKNNIRWIESAWLLIIFLISVIQLVGSTYNPFIYFNF